MNSGNRKKRRIGIVGFGHVGQFLVGEILKRDGLELSFVWNRTTSVLRGKVDEMYILENLLSFAERSPDLIVEVAHPSITVEYGETFLNVADYMIGSPTALANSDVENRLRQKACSGSHGIYIPSGALWGGTDIKKMADRGTLQSRTDSKEGMEIRNKMADFSLSYSSGAFVLQNFSSNSSSDSTCSLEDTGSQIVPLLACKLDMSSHLLSLGVSSGQQRSEDEKISEVDLILNRAGQFVATGDEKITMTICPRHRKKLTTDWAGRKSNTCSYPTHRGERKSMKKPRRVNATLSEEIYQIHHASVPIGSAVCSTCRGTHYQSRKTRKAGCFLSGEQGLKVTMKKHPSCYRLDEPLKSVNAQAKSEAVVIYDGCVRDLCPLAPNNVNTMAAAALAAHNLGFDKTQGCIVADPSLDAHVVEVDVLGPGEEQNMFTVKTVRHNPAVSGAVTGNATYASFLSSMLGAQGQGPGLHLC